MTSKKPGSSRSFPKSPAASRSATSQSTARSNRKGSLEESSLDANALNSPEPMSAGLAKSAASPSVRRKFGAGKPAHAKKRGSQLALDESTKRTKKGSAGNSIRLQKILAQAGIASRRHSEEIIREGRVRIDGVVVTELGTKVNPQTQEVLVDNQVIQPERKAYYIVNKPVGHISTNDDPAGRPRVVDLLPKTKERLYPVGRLDEASQGLMLVTNDGLLANKLLHPRYGVPKTYRVQIAGTPDWQALESLRSGQQFSEAVFKIDSFKVLREQGESTFLEIVLKEGHNREIRRLFARIGHKVLRLQRIAFGPLQIGRLRSGEYRHLTGFEVRLLKKAASGLSSDTGFPAHNQASLNVPANSKPANSKPANSKPANSKPAAGHKTAKPKSGQGAEKSRSDRTRHFRTTSAGKTRAD